MYLYRYMSFQCPSVGTGVSSQQENKRRGWCGVLCCTNLGPLSTSFVQKMVAEVSRKRQTWFRILCFAHRQWQNTSLVIWYVH